MSVFMSNVCPEPDQISIPTRIEFDGYIGDHEFKQKLDEMCPRQA